MSENPCPVGVYVLVGKFQVQANIPCGPWTVPEVGRDAISIPIISSEGSRLYG